MPPLSLAQLLTEPALSPLRRPAPSRPQAGQTSAFARDLAAATSPPDQRSVPRTTPGNRDLQGMERAATKTNDTKTDEAQPSEPTPLGAEKSPADQVQASAENHPRCEGADRAAELATPAVQIDPLATTMPPTPVPLALAALLAQPAQSQPAEQPPGTAATEQVITGPSGIAGPSMLAAPGPNAPGIVPAAAQDPQTGSEQQAGQEPDATSPTQAAREPQAILPATAPPAQPAEARSAGLMPPALAPAWAPHSATATPALSSPATPPVTAPLPIQHVPVTIASMASEGTRRFDIRLDPPDLGRIDVTLAVDADGGIRTHLSVERPETLQLLRQDAHRLDQALADAGLTADPAGPEFSLRNSGGGEERQRTPQRENAPGHAGTGEKPDQPPPRPAPRLLRTASTRIDLSL